MNGHQTHHSQGRGVPEMSREQMNQANRNIYNGDRGMITPLDHFRKEKLAKLLIYGIRDELGETSLLRKHIFKKYKSALYKLMNRLEYERKMLVRQELVLRGRDPEKALANSEIMK